MIPVWVLACPTVQRDVANKTASVAGHRLPTIVLCMFFFLLAGCHRSTTYYSSRGASFFAKGQYADAEINYRKAIQANISNGEAHAGLGLTELKQGHPADAYRSLTRAVDLLPGRDDLKVTLGNLVVTGYLDDKDRPKRLYDQLVKLSDSLMAKYPFDALRFKGYLAAFDNDTPRALELFERANRAKPMDPVLIVTWAQELFRSNRFAEAEKLALDLIRKDSSYRPMYDVLYREYMAAHRPGDAEKILQLKAANNPKDFEPILLLATHYAKAGQREQMAATLRRLLDDPRDFPQARMKVGDFYAARQEWDEAMQQFEAGAKSNPGQRDEYLKKLTNLYLVQGKGEQASALVREITAHEPANDEARAVKASLLLSSGKPEEIAKAVSNFQDLTKNHPDHPAWHYNLGRAYLAQGDTSRAVTEFQGAIKLRDTYIAPRLILAEISLQKKDYTQALANTKAVLSLRPNLPQALLLHSAALIDTQDYLGAREELTQLESTFPQAREVKVQFGYLELAQRRFPQAEERFWRMYQKDNNDAEALNGLVETYTAERQLEKAYSFLSAESVKRPSAQSVSFQLGEVAVRLLKYDVALNLYRRLLASNPRSAELYLRLGSLYRAQHDLDNAATHLTVAATLAPHDPRAFALLAETLYSSGQKVEALNYYRRLIAIQPDNAVALNDLAYVIAEVGGNLNEALDLAQRALKASPQQPSFADTLGWIYLKQGRLEVACKIFRDLARKYPDKPGYHYHLALALLQTGDKATAKSELQIALSERPPKDIDQQIRTALAIAGTNSHP